ncbi:hypothetical protein [Cupriavidus basilensis]|uniref:hypothetical protein n=1 Tax=Cupriavidus basilensis TaxID=68895 RepID=UPI0020A6D6A2|nr:hypothetical protein [Cupriavidus basilensis]MCP3025164.1 hypothetical protein [Cupriavidus basilensis]
MTRKRCFALGCALLLAAFIKPVFAQQLSESEQVLAGLKRISNSADYPAELTIPDPWIAAFWELVRETRETGREAGACLELTTPDAIQQSSEAALAAYQALLSKRATMDAEGFKREETRLRRAVDSVSTGGQGHARTWKVGAMQGGKQQSVLIERNGVKCAGAVLGSVHTHPEKISIESLSDRDFTNHIAEHRSVSIVLYSDRMCALVTAHEPADSRRATVLPRFTATWVAYSPWRIEGLHDAVIRHGAHMAEMFGSAYYCGALGSRLNRMTPAEVDPENPVLVLAAKAWVVSMKNRAPGKWSAIDFPYTPEIDPGFKAYLERNFGSTKARWALEGTRQNLFEQIILEMYPDGGYATGGTYIAIPDQRDESNLPYSIYFKCNPLGAAPHAGKLNCGATYGLRGEKLRMAEVDYSEANGIGTALDLDGRTPGKYWSIEVNTKTAVTTQGEVIVHDGTNAFFEITGKGSMQTPEVLYEGQMVHGKPEGSGRVRLVGDDRWYSATAKDGVITKGNPLK